MSVERVLVSGASGFIGSRVVPMITAAGVEVLAVSTRARELGRDLSVEAIDLESALSESPASERVKSFRPQAFLHLGWGRLPDYSSDACLENLAISLSLTRVALGAGVTRFVGAGSCWEYGSRLGELSEDNPAPDSVFARTKDILRRTFHTIQLENQVESRWARVFYAYGPGQRSASLIPRTIESLRLGQPIRLKDTNKCIDLIHVDDVARALVDITLKEGPTGVFNIGSGTPTHVEAVVQFIRHAFDSNGEKLEIPTSDTLNTSWADISRIKREFGWSPEEDLYRGIEKLVAKV